MLVYKPLKEGFEYIPMTQRSEEVPFKLRLRVLDIEELAMLQDILVTRTATEVKNNYGAYWVQTCLAGIIDWEGMVDNDNKPLPMLKTDKGTIAREYLNKIPYNMIEEIATVITAVSNDPSTIKIFEL